jgi:hypothetical protein
MNKWMEMDKESAQHKWFWIFIGSVRLFCNYDQGVLWLFKLTDHQK